MSDTPNGWGTPEDNSPWGNAQPGTNPPQQPLPQNRPAPVQFPAPAASKPNALVPVLCAVAGIAILGCGFFAGKYFFSVKKDNPSAGSTAEVRPDTTAACDTTTASETTVTTVAATTSTTAAETETLPPETTVPTTAPTTQPTAPPTTAAPRASISSARIVGVTHTMGDGYMYRLDVTGNYSYWIASVTYESPGDGDNTHHMTVSSRDLTADYPYLTGGSAILSISANVTPYDAAGNAGEPVYTAWNRERDVEVQVSVETCNLYGYINTQGHAHVDGFSSSYILKNGAVRRERDDLESGWHVVAKRMCWNYDLTWYELYDADDGDYYGWVDSTYLDLYP